MNIFYLDENIEKCAQYHVDSHVIKMILESAQILCTALLLNGLKAPYKSTHKKHPCVLWASASLSNWMWLKKLTKELNKEYCYRWSKEKDHQSYRVVDSLEVPKNVIKDHGITERPQTMPIKYKIPGNPVQAYRQYYKLEKVHIHKYTRREAPEWIKHNN